MKRKDVIFLLVVATVPIVLLAVLLLLSLLSESEQATHEDYLFPDSMQRGSISDSPVGPQLDDSAVTMPHSGESNGTSSNDRDLNLGNIAVPSDITDK